MCSSDLSPAALAAVRARLAAANPQRIFDDADAEEQRQAESKMSQRQREEEGSEDDSEDEEAREAAESAHAEALRAERRALQEQRNARKKEKQEQAKIKQEQALSINFAKRLAHNDKKVRDASVKSLRRWMLRREHVADADLMKIWKGLFYCFWMSDKVPVQQQLADSLSDLLLPPLPFDRALLFFRTFLVTMAREWTAIDQLRMDKFMSLARRVLQKQIAVLQAEQWGQDKVEEFTDVLVESDLLSDQTGSRGFSFHFIDCFLAELERVSAAQPKHAVPFAALNTLLTPFYHLIALGRDQTLVDRTVKEVFEPLLELCATPSQSEREEQMQDGEEPEEMEGPAAEFPHIHATVRGNADQISQVLFSLAADPALLPRSRKLLYSLRASFDESHRLFLQPLDAEEFAEDEEMPALPGADALAKKKKQKKQKGLKRKAETQDAEGEEDAEAAPKKSKKLNKRQRLLSKRRKKEALLGAEPGAAMEQKLRDRMAQQAAAEAAQEEAGEQAEFEEEEEQVPSPPTSRKRKSQTPAPEPAEPEPPVASGKKGKHVAAKSSKAATKRASMQSTIEEESEESLQEFDESPISPPQKKKARASTAAAASSSSSSTPSMPTRAPPPTPSTGVSFAPSAASPTTPPKAPVAGFTTPQSKAKTPRSKQGVTSPNGAPSLSAVVPSSFPSLSTPLPSALRTPSASLAPPSSVKKSIRIDLSANKVRSFNRWSREEIREETSTLLAKSPTASLIKPASIAFFIKHNKNGRELAKRQKTLAQQINEAANSDGDQDDDSHRSTPRARAADFFFEDQDSH